MQQHSCSRLSHYAFIPDNQPIRLKLCVSLGDQRLKRVENTLEERSCQGLARLFLHFRCVWSRSDTNTASMMHIKKGSIWSRQRRGAPSHSTRILQRKKAAKVHWCSAASLINKRLTPASQWTLHFVLLSKSPSDFHKEFLFEGTWKNDMRERASKNRLLIYIQSFRYRLLYLNINIYFFRAVCLKWDVALSGIIMQNCKNIWVSVWRM